MAVMGGFQTFEGTLYFHLQWSEDGGCWPLSTIGNYPSDCQGITLSEDINLLLHYYYYYYYLFHTPGDPNAVSKP
jgi:hypothetical protein